MDITSSSEGRGSESSSRDRLLYLTTCLIGLRVEVQVKDGSVYSGILHAADIDEGFGVVLKKARLTKVLTIGGQKAASDLLNRVYSKPLFIPANDLVQVVAKDVPFGGDGLSNESKSEKQGDIMLDSNISQPRHVEVERELQPWMPDDDDPQHPGLEHTFDSPSTGTWDQFKANEILFGVKSTFNEELYTTKLRKGPQRRELEEKASRIAREIEGEETHDLHLAEERGTHLYGNLDIDEETKYSSVNRGVDDSGYEDEDVMLNAPDTSVADTTNGRNGENFDGSMTSSGSLSQDKVLPAKFNANQELHHSGSLTSDDSSIAVSGFDDDNRVQENRIIEKGQRGNTFIRETLNEEVLMAETDGSQSLLDGTSDGSEKAGISSAAATDSSMMGENKISSGERLDDRSGKVCGTADLSIYQLQPGSSESSTSKTDALALSPTSSVASMSSVKSALNPNAMEFKLDRNVTTVVPSQWSLKPMPPANDGSFYLPSTRPEVPHIHGVPLTVGVPAFIGYPAVLFYPQPSSMQPPASNFPANRPQYGLQMNPGRPRQVTYRRGRPK